VDSYLQIKGGEKTMLLSIFTSLMVLGIEKLYDHWYDSKKKKKDNPTQARESKEE
jgi:hypothetical protein